MLLSKVMEPGMIMSSYKDLLSSMHAMLEAAKNKDINKLKDMDAKQSMLMEKLQKLEAQPKSSASDIDDLYRVIEIQNELLSEIENLRRK